VKSPGGPSNALPCLSSSILVRAVETRAHVVGLLNRCSVFEHTETEHQTMTTFKTDMLALTITVAMVGAAEPSAAQQVAPVQAPTPAARPAPFEPPPTRESPSYRRYVLYSKAVGDWWYYHPGNGFGEAHRRRIWHRHSRHSSWGAISCAPVYNQACLARQNG
jgi:hypothetical protein